MTNSNLTNTQIMLSGQAFFSLRTQATIKPFSSFCDFERVKHAFVSSSLDYCNVLYVEEISQSTLPANSSERCCWTGQSFFFFFQVFFFSTLAAYPL